MFKLESYITPIILSYVNRYINNFRPEDTNVSLWGGEATFHNLELNLEVLEEELQLPFSFVSGSIRELSIYVPWTKITSEPIRITINTIECILNLKGKEAKKVPKPREKKAPGQNQKVVEAPPGYIQSLINKIVSNISIHINNLILKYVEEDIVLSMNVKLLKFQSANEKWESAYSDLSAAQVTLRKVISISDLTLCLDKRNASGKIEVYQEPVLYKCSMTIHLLRHYHSATASRASTTRLDIYCNSMEFSMTEQQVPMLLRILMLVYALQQKQLKPETQVPTTDCQSGISDVKENPEGNETWTGWAWSYVSSVLPAPWEEQLTEEQLRSHKGHTLHCGFYVDRLSLTFKVSECSTEKGYYSHKKLRHFPTLTLELQGLYSDTVIHGLQWFSCTGGISEALLIPNGFCSCGQAEVNESTAPYLKLGSPANLHKTDSLFDADAVENKGDKRLYNTSWDLHMRINTEQVLLEKTPAFAFDYVYQVEIPNGMGTDISLSDVGSNLEFSNLSESSSLRLCIGPFRLRVCSGILHRVDTLQVAASYYDYPPYYVLKPDLPLEDLLPPSAEDFDALSEFIPRRSMRMTFFAPVIELELMDHPYFEASRKCLFRRNKKASVSTMPTTTSILPKITIECQFIDISQESPMYLNRLVHTTCQLPEPPDKLFHACYIKQDIKVVGLLSRLVTNPACQSIILTPFSLYYSIRSIVMPQYWRKADIPHEEVTFESESLTINSTKSKMLVIYSIMEKLISKQPDPPGKGIYSSSLLTDASRDYVFPHMELCVEGIRYRKVTTNSTKTVDLSLNSVQAFIFEYVAKFDNSAKSPKDIQQVLFVSGPDPTEKSQGQELPLLTTTVQFPLSPGAQTHPPILIFNLQEVRICVDPLLCKWLLYVPKSFLGRSDFTSKGAVSEASTSLVDTPRKPSGHQLESVHSSSDRETPHTSVIRTKGEARNEESVDMQEQIYVFLKTWFDVWKGMFLCGDISQCTIYFPMLSLSAVGSQGIQEAVEQAVNQENPPDVMVITLPFANIRSAQRQSVSKYLRVLPVSLPDNIWSVDKSSFPWTVSISELSCYTIQFGNKLTFLKPVSLSATVGLSTRPSKNELLDGGPSSTVGSPNTKIDIGYLGVCVHIDMTPVVISTSEVQVYLFASILYGLMEVATNMLPKKTHKPHKPSEIVPPVINKGSSTMSPTIVKDHTADSASEMTPTAAVVKTENLDTDTVKLTAWIQWTITRFTIELLSTEYNVGSERNQEEFESLQPKLKLVLDAEDIVSSLDFQSVYLKVKSKIGSASIQHFKRPTPNSKWEAGPYSGIVMRLRDDLVYGLHQEENSFISVTITRASCQHTHTLWGAVQKQSKEKKGEIVNSQAVKSRYITEVVVNIQPLDFVVSMSTLRSFYMVLIPLLNIPVASGVPEPTSNSSSYLTNQTLPLAYLECRDIRLIMPASDLDMADHDTFIMQISKIGLNPQAVNPICRTSIRSDIYDQAAHARILNIPGSEVEDRQYQLDIFGISFCTGVWDDIITILSPTTDVLSNLRGLSENPALEWNNLEKGQPNSTPSLNLRYIVEKFDISILAAPAMVYKDSTTICGHAIEINFVSDISVNLSLHQIKLSSALLRDFLILATPLLFEDGILKKPQIRFPYSRFDFPQEFREENEDAAFEGTKDSGIETSDIKSQSAGGPASSILLSKPLIESSDKQHPFPRQPSQTPYIYASIPLEVVLTSGKVMLSLYQVNESKPVLAKHKGKKKKTSKKTDKDQGYEASEESFDEKSDNYKKFTPLLFVSFTQPNAFFAKQQLGRRLQASCFNVNLKLGGPDHTSVSHMPLEADFPINLLETRSGSPHPSSGILPSFFTLKYTKGVGKNGKLEVNFSKPTKLLCKTSKWMYLLVVKDKMVETFKSGGGMDSVTKLLEAANSSKKLENSSKIKPNKHTDSYSKFQEIKDLMQGTTSVAVNFDQVIFAIAAESEHEIHIGMQKFKSELSLSNRPEKLNLQLFFGCLTASVLYGDYKKLLLNPWSIKCDVAIFWESWQAIDSDPQIQITAESDAVIVDLTSEQLKCIDMVIKDLNDFISTLPSKDSQVEKVESDQTKAIEKDQHYKDDLRAGAFQFVDSSGDNTSELPLPYQVMFWNKSTSAMAWRYPQPRALTKVRVFPVPYKMALGSQENLLVLCHLEYWSECRNCYMPYTQFYLSENEICHLNLPEGRPKQVVASTWRVVITTTNDKNDNLDNCSYKVTLSPRALAACMRIDSYFNKCLIPNLNTALYVTKIEVNLYNFFPKNVETNLPTSLKNYKSDLCYPENQRFLTLSVENVTSYVALWSLDVLAAEIGCSTQCSVLDYAFLTDQVFIPPFSSKLELNMSNGLQCNFISKPIQVKFGPSIAHTFAVSSQMWQSKNAIEGSAMDFIMVTRYVVCNDTNVVLRFGQSETEESILLRPRQFHLYSWRSQKKKQALRLSMEKLQWDWSETLAINEDGIKPVYFKSNKRTVVFVCVKSLSKTQKQVTFHGQLTVYNLLSEHLEVKVVEALTEKESKEAEFKNAESHIVAAKLPAPSMFVTNKKNYFLRLRFFGLESAWTGDIPLREHLTGAQPWLVKVPLQDRGQFLSVWCRIVVQDFNKSKRILAMIWPLFMIRSNLPMSTKVHIESPTLGVHLDSEIYGKGVLQQLYCPGTIDHSHQLTFELEEGSTGSNANPYVPLNYSLVDQQKFFKKSPNEDIDVILETLSNYDKVKWPYFGNEMDHIEWTIDSQPLTHVQVRYQNASQYSCSLLVELLPWCLTVNTLGTTVAIMLKNVELCRICHHGMVAPPRLEEAFHIGVCSGNHWFFSGPLQLAKSDWGQTFYMPKITGTIPLDGTIKTSIQCDSYLCMISITSSISNEIRLLRLSSTHVLSNHMSMQVQVLCLAIADNKVVTKVPKDVDQFCFTVPPHLQKSHSGIPIMQWCTLKDEGEISSNEYALYISFCVEPSQGWSCPIRVDKPVLRKAFSISGKDCSIPVVLTAQDVKNQIFLAIQNNSRPQLFIDNKTSVPLFCGQSMQDDSGIAGESQHFTWNCKIEAFKSVYYNMPILAEKFPELPQVNFSEKVSFAYDCGGDSALEWSAGVSIVNNNNLFIRIPHYGDVKVTIVNTACTTIFTIESVSQVEISARDIRVRLSLRETEALSAFEIASKGLERFVKGQVDAQSSSKISIESQVGTAKPPSIQSLDFNDGQATATAQTSSLLVPTLPLGEKFKSIELNVFVKSFAITLLTDLESDGEERWELASLVCDSVLVKALQSENLKVRLSISDLQFDNQLYTREPYDFPVVLVGQDRKLDKKINILSTPIETLLEILDSDPLINVDFILETCSYRFVGKTYTGVKQIKLTVNPLSCFIEDIFITRLIDYLKTFSPIQVVMWPSHEVRLNIGMSSSSVNIPELVFWQCQLLAQPLTMRNFVVNPVSILLSVHSSVKMYIALDQSPLQFSKFERKRLLTTHYRLGYALTMHYLSGAIFGAGWVVSSLELLGSPGGLARAMGTGIRDFVSLPYRGLWLGPWAFLRGITNGSASLMRHFTAGTLQSVTKLASSVARNLDRLTLDEEHQKRSEEQRRQRPQGVTQGFVQGLTSLGISLLGAVGGIAHHPLQSVMADDASPRSFAAGLGLGLVGVLTKPLSGAAELVALTGQGLLQGAGWNSLPDPRIVPQILKISLANNSMLKYNWKFINLPHSQILYVTEATSVYGSNIFAAVALILTAESVVIVDLEEDDITKVIPLHDISINPTSDPSLLSLKLVPPAKEKIERNDDDIDIEMDPFQRARVADYVRSTVGLLHLPEVNSEHSDISISPLNSPCMSPSPTCDESAVLNFYVSTQKMAYFSCLLTLAKQHGADDHHFPVL